MEKKRSRCSSVRTRTTSTPRGGHAAPGDLVINWALVVVGIVAVIISAGYVFNENLHAYGLQCL